jgi:hypothetical protein
MVLIPEILRPQRREAKQQREREKETFAISDHTIIITHEPGKRNVE